MGRLTTALAILAVGIAVAIVIAVVRDRPIAPVRSVPSDPCHTVPNGDVDLIARHRACEAACDGGDMPACGLAATDLVTGLGAPPDGARAAELYEKACGSSRAPSACLLLGDLYADGVLVTRDDERAKDAWTRGCKDKDRACCTRLEADR
jgi:hypothetical protein